MKANIFQQLLVKIWKFKNEELCQTSDNIAARNPKYQQQTFFFILDSDQNICFILHFAIKLQNIYAWKLTIYISSITISFYKYDKQLFALSLKK